MDATPSPLGPGGGVGEGQPLHWLWQPAPQYSAVPPQKPNWLQQRQLAHVAPPNCEPHLWTGLQPVHWLWQPAPQ
jgi:hypothetical protein